MEIRDYLHLLCEQQGPSGFERPVAEVAKEAIAPYVDESCIDVLGNLIATKKCGRKNAKKMLIAAHLDEIGFMVTGYDEGFLTFTQIGGVDGRMLPGRDVSVMCDPPLLGVICTLPPHVLTAEQMEKMIPKDKLRIDLGLTEAQAKKMVPVGTTITFRTEGFDMGSDLYVSKTLDDRACFAALIRAAELLKGKKLPWDVVFVGSVCEEVAGNGAAVSVFKEAPAVCMAIDVTHGKTPDAGSGDQVFEMGGGPALGVGPNINKVVGLQLKGLAEEKDIPVQTEVCPGQTGTDAWSMQVAREGVPTGLIGLPLKYMHTPVETVNINDIEYCARLVAEYAQNPGEEVLSWL